jgi:hypothetical protein
MRDVLSPEDVVRAAIAALEAERWADLLPLVDPSALAPLAESFVPALREMAARRPRTAEEIRESEPWLPLPVAEYQAEQERTWVEKGRPQLLRDWGVRDLSELEPLSPDELFVRYVAANSPGARFRQALAVSDVTIDEAEMEEAVHPPSLRRTVIGSVVEAEEGFAHVLFREHYDGEGSGITPNVRMTTLVRTPAGWRLQMDGSLLVYQGWMHVHRTAPDEAG